jgi:hypothetical protein
MSNTQYVFIKRSAVPGPAALQQSIAALGLPANLELDPELNLLTDSGFSPCTLDGRATGLVVFDAAVSTRNTERGR